MREETLAEGNAQPTRGARRADRGRIKAIGIVIPARNEQARLGRCLHAVQAASAHLAANVDALIEVRAVVVLDSCTDRSAEIADGCLDIETIATDVGNVGAARSLGADALMSGVARPDRTFWLANTDADSTVPRDWLTHMIIEAQRGADLILGTVEPNGEASSRMRQAWKHRHSAGDGHQHVHGANLGIRGSTYLDLGGWPCRSSGEDATLVHAAEADPTVRIVRTGAIPVVTSGRIDGRAPHGFAHYLKRLAEEIELPTLAPVR